MYALDMPVSAIRTKVRQEFERHRYVNKLSVVDVLLFQSHSEFQVRERVSWEDWSYPAILIGYAAGNIHSRIHPGAYSFSFCYSTKILTYI